MNDLEATHDNSHDETASAPRTADQRPVHDDARFWYRICGIERKLRMEVEAEFEAEKQRRRATDANSKTVRPSSPTGRAEVRWRIPSVNTGLKFAAGLVVGILGGGILFDEPQLILEDSIQDREATIDRLQNSAIGQPPIVDVFLSERDHQERPSKVRGNKDLNAVMVRELQRASGRQ